MTGVHVLQLLMAAYSHSWLAQVCLPDEHNHAAVISNMPVCAQQPWKGMLRGCLLLHDTVPTRQQGFGVLSLIRTHLCTQDAVYGTTSCGLALAIRARQRLPVVARVCGVYGPLQPQVVCYCAGCWYSCGCKAVRSSWLLGDDPSVLGCFAFWRATQPAPLLNGE